MCTRLACIFFLFKRLNTRFSASAPGILGYIHLLYVLSFGGAFDRPN